MPTFAPAQPAQPAQERPQFATFDSSKAVVNEDALPAMPTWKEGRDVHVQVEEQPMPEKKGDVELDRLDHNGSVTSGSIGGVAAAAVPGARRSPGPGRSPVSQRDDYGYQQNNSYGGDSAPYNNQGQYGQPYGQQDRYRQGSPAQKISPVYGAGAGYAQQQQQHPYQQQPYGRQSPGPNTAYNSRDHLSEYNDIPAAYNQPPAAYDHPPTTYGQPQTSYSQPAPYQNLQDTYGRQEYHDAPSYDYQAPPASNPYGYNASIAPSYHTHDPAPMEKPPLPASPASPPPSLVPGRPTPAPTPAPAYPGQRSYTPAADTAPQRTSPPPQVPAQQPYRAFTPGVEQQKPQQQQQQQYTGVNRKAVDGSYREL